MNDKLNVKLNNINVNKIKSFVINIIKIENY